MQKRTPLYSVHEKLGARLIDFGGFQMPLQYSGILKEHQAVRERCGVFDVSHMGEIIIRGDKALDLIQFATINDASKLVPGKVQYSAMCYENGGIVDDLLVYCFSDDSYMLVVNASNKDKDLEWITRLNDRFGAIIEDRSDDFCLIAVQGPKSISIIEKLTDFNVSELAYYTFTTATFAGFTDVIISATGYTGEKGFEIYFDGSGCDPVTIWNAILDAGKDEGIEPAGLGCRDTLRLEMGFALYGNDINDNTNPLEAGLGWITKPDKGDFCGRDAILKQKEHGAKRKLTGLKTSDRRAIPRSNYSLVTLDGKPIGSVTSGGQSPVLGIGIGMGYVSTEYASPGTIIGVEIRGAIFEAELVKPPFIKKK